MNNTIWWPHFRSAHLSDVDLNGFYWTLSPKYSLGTPYGMGGRDPVSVTGRLGPTPGADST